MLRIDGRVCPTRKAASPPPIASLLARAGPDRCALDVDEAVAVRPANTFWWKTLRLDHSITGGDRWQGTTSGVESSRRGRTSRGQAPMPVSAWRQPKQPACSISMSASTIRRGRRIKRWSKRISSATCHLAPPTTWVESLFRRDLAASMANVALRSEPHRPGLWFGSPRGSEQLF